MQYIWTPSKDLVWDLTEKSGHTTNTENVIVDPTHLEDTDNLCTMNNLHEAPLIFSLRRRYKSDSIYTLAGDILISINPFKSITGLYDEPIKYFSDIFNFEVTSNIAKICHVYAIANNALQRVRSSKSSFSQIKNQSIIVSGESGAGKTEAAKSVMQFLVDADKYCSRDCKNSATGGVLDVSKILLDGNTILEAFGNARTLRNNNSSRFGKYTKIHYDTSVENSLRSASTETFLLERSRLTSSK